MKSQGPFIDPCDAVPASGGCRAPGVPHVSVGGIPIAAMTEDQVVDHVRHCWEVRRGGAIVTLNVDILRIAAQRADAREFVLSADLVVADGMPILWAAALAGDTLPARVTGASLLWSLAGAAADAGQSVFVLGGPPGAAEGACAALVSRFPQLSVAGTLCPPRGFETSRDSLDEVKQAVVRAKPGLVLVGLGFPKQETVIAHIRTGLPGAWYLGCGAAVAFASGDIARAPAWMQRAGLEWAHRLVHEPFRLTERYLKHDVPVAVALLGAAGAARLHSLGTGSGRTSPGVPHIPHQLRRSSGQVKHPLGVLGRQPAPGASHRLPTVHGAVSGAGHPASEAPRV